MLEEECRKEEPVPDMVQQNPAVQQPMHQAMQQAMPHPMQQHMQMQGIQTSPIMEQTMGGAPIANMGVMPGSVPGPPSNMVGPPGLSNEDMDEMKNEI